MPTTLIDFLAPQNVLLDVRASDKAALLREMSQRAAEALQMPADSIYAELTKREQLGSTGIGDGIAIPHARIAGLKAAFGMAARLKTPIDYESVDGQQIDLVFLLLAPVSSEKEHLNALAAVARKLRDPAAACKLRSITNQNDFYSLLTAESSRS